MSETDQADHAKIFKPAPALPIAFTGHGTIFYQLGKSIERFGTIEKIINTMRRCHMTHAWIKIHGRYEPVGDEKQNREVIEALRDAGIAVAGWGWCQGENIEKEIGLAVGEMNKLGLDDYVADIESFVKRSHWDEPDLEQFLAGVRGGIKGGIAMDSYSIIDWHTPNLVKVAAPLVDAFVPQIYWFNCPSKKMSDAYDGRYKPNRAADYVNLCLEQWEKLVPGKPLILTGQAFWENEKDEINFVQTDAEAKLDEFLTEFKGWQRFVGMNWWYFGEEVERENGAMSDRMLRSIEKARIGA